MPFGMPRKRTLKKILLSSLVAILLVIALAAAALYLWAGRMFKTAVEAAGQKALGVEVTVADVDLSLLKGRISLQGLVIRNPEGYQHGTFLTLRQGDIEVETGSLLSDTVRIKQITLDGIQVVMEQKGLTSNVQEIVDAIKGQSDGQSSGKGLLIDQLEMAHIDVKVKLLPVPGKVDTLTFPLNRIKMADLGRDKAINAPELTARIVLALVAGILEKGLGILPTDLVNTVGKTLGTAGHLGRQLFNAGTGTGGQVLKGVGRLGQGLVNLMQSDGNDPNARDE